MKTFVKWLDKKGYEYTLETIMNGYIHVIMISDYKIEMYKNRRGGYLTNLITGKKQEFYQVKQIEELIESLI